MSTASSTLHRSHAFPQTGIVARAQLAVYSSFVYGCLLEAVNHPRARPRANIEIDSAIVWP